ncbi:hypothetical protein TWF569_003343 [Orbilia oligospora]|uniref:tRNA wybutosine-synthesizing protein 3 n=1 Tax=Orbilia oligospora TaxID=2813651 RepID=A0A7C8IZF3_ORBOL|nr:hypothetical protein TWF706_004565 [Orbilia oligospora]KAF3079373.1 hypothetical protein TWF102_002907 [Orbilia oligospora]KAF3082807.1 hypothetical protein TWF103_003112 [Orbilia oligospora]KAF3120189.1 hypothetical protein TWF569_003343 [Orbilia oligospora]KAF3120443.1 hypothetical protein TWF703_002601 [Orbilia oligospora]
MSSERLKQEFNSRKKGILGALASGTDASPKGSVDKQIIPIMELLNSHPGTVTTSSCSGRVSVFLEGRKQSSTASASQQERETDVATAGGKGGDGRWLLVTHDNLLDDILQESRDDNAFLNTMFGGIPSEPAATQLIGELSSGTRYVHFKFEPMILHVLTETLEIANRLLTCAISSSFRESGIVSPLKNPIVAIRTMGLAFDAPVGIYDPEKNVIQRFIDPPGLRVLARLTGDRFRENSRRIDSLYKTLLSAMEAPETPLESKKTRAFRKKAEGMDKGRKLAAAREARVETDPLEDGISFQEEVM